MAALVILVVLFLFFPVDDTLVVRLGWAVTVALVEGGIIAGTFRRKSMPGREVLKS